MRSMPRSSRPARGEREIGVLPVRKLAHVGVHVLPEQRNFLHAADREMAHFREDVGERARDLLAGV